MKNKLSIHSFIFIAAAVGFGCRGPVKEATQTQTAVSGATLHTGDDQYLRIDTQKSVLTWKGGMLNGLNNHNGYVNLSKGELQIENGKLIGGTVVVNMNTIEDDKHHSDNGLIRHLKDPDFFDVKKFPFATIVLTKVEPINGASKVTGDLTIKGITHPVTFIAKTEVKNELVEANGKLVIDRTKWDVRYKSAKFYANLADQAMSDSIAFEMKIVARK